MDDDAGVSAWDPSQYLRHGTARKGRTDGCSCPTVAKCGGVVEGRHDPACPRHGIGQELDWHAPATCPQRAG